MIQHLGILAKDPLLLHCPQGADPAIPWQQLVRECFEYIRSQAIRQVKPPSLALVTYNNTPHAGLFERCLAAQRLEATVTARDYRPWDWMGKIEPLLSSIQVMDEAYILCADNRDVLLIGDPQQIVTRFESMACEMLVASTNANWPPDPESNAFENSLPQAALCLRHAHLSAGCYVAKREFLIDRLQEIIAESGRHRHRGKFDDQLAWRRLHRRHYPAIRIDCECRIFLRYDAHIDEP